jgi:hypothetical protein
VDVGGGFRERGGIGQGEAEFRELVAPPQTNAKPLVPRAPWASERLLNPLSGHALIMRRRCRCSYLGSIGRA